MDLPQEILERIAYFGGGYVCCVLGINLRLPMLREMIFHEGGPGTILRQILDRQEEDKEVDIRALLTVRKYIPSELAIAWAVLKGSEVLLKRVFAVWDSRLSDIGCMLSVKTQFTFGVDYIQHDAQMCKYARNKYYAETGQLSRVDLTVEDPYRDVICVSYLTREIYEELKNISTPQTLVNIAGYLGYSDDVCRLLNADIKLDVRKIIDNAPIDVAIFVYEKFGHCRCSHGAHISYRLDTLEELDLLQADCSIMTVQKKTVLSGDVVALAKFLRDRTGDEVLFCLEKCGKLDMLDELLENLFEIGFVPHDLLLDLIGRYGLDIFTIGKWSKYVTHDTLMELYDAENYYISDVIDVVGKLVEGNLVDIDQLSFRTPSMNEIRAVTKKYGDNIIGRYDTIYIYNVKDFIWFWTIFGHNYTIKNKKRDESNYTVVEDGVLYFGNWDTRHIAPNGYHTDYLEELNCADVAIAIACMYCSS